MGQIKELAIVALGCVAAVEVLKKYFPNYVNDKEPWVSAILAFGYSAFGNLNGVNLNMVISSFLTGAGAGLAHDKLYNPYLKSIVTNVLGMFVKK